MDDDFLVHVGCRTGILSGIPLLYGHACALQVECLDRGCGDILEGVGGDDDLSNGETLVRTAFPCHTVLPRESFSVNDLAFAAGSMTTVFGPSG